MAERQSPVDIPADAPRHLDGLELDYRPTPLALAADPYAVRVEPAPGSSARIDGTRYELDQFHLHCPSEHTLDGVHLPAEIHFVHRSDAGVLAVIGVLLTTGAEHQGLAALVAALAGGGPPMIDPAALTPPDREHVRYDGSLTTPPYSEDVSWRVLTTPVAISLAQLRALEAVHHGNNRPIQPLDGREFR